MNFIDIFDKIERGELKSDSTGNREQITNHYLSKQNVVEYYDYSLDEEYDPIEWVYTGGTFDLFHKGHVDLLKECSKLGKVVVSLNTDEFVERYKGSRPIMSYEERLEVLSSCRYVSKIIKNVGEEDSKPCILFTKPKVLAIGSDWLEKDYLKQMSIDTKFLEENGITLMYIPRPSEQNRISTTEIKRRIRDEA